MVGLQACLEDYTPKGLRNSNTAKYSFHMTIRYLTCQYIVYVHSTRSLDQAGVAALKELHRNGRLGSCNRAGKGSHGMCPNL